MLSRLGERQTFVVKNSCSNITPTHTHNARIHAHIIHTHTHTYNSKAKVDDKPSRYRFSEQKFRKRGFSNPLQQTADDRSKCVANRHADTTGLKKKKWTRKAFRQKTVNFRHLHHGISQVTFSTMYMQVLDIQGDHSFSGTAESTECRSPKDLCVYVT